MKHRSLLHKTLLQMSLATTLWLLVGFAGVSTAAQLVRQEPVLVEQGSETEENKQDEQLTAAHLMHAVACLPHDNTSHLAHHQARMNLRTTRAARRITAHWMLHIGLPAILQEQQYLIPYSFTLAPSGVTYISPRACSYYVFALRHILD